MEEINYFEENENEKNEEQENEKNYFNYHKNENNILMVILMLIAGSVIILFLIGFKSWISILAIAIIVCCITYFILCIKFDNPDSTFYFLNFRKANYNQQYINAENKLIDLINQTPNKPAEFGDKRADIKCIEITDYITKFCISANNVSGLRQWLYKYADIWASNFGDTDGADIQQINGKFYITFDRKKASKNVKVRW